MVNGKEFYINIAKRMKRGAIVDEELIAKDSRIARLAAQGIVPLRKDPIPAIVAGIVGAAAVDIATDVIEKTARPVTSGVDYATKIATYDLYKGRVTDALMNAIGSMLYFKNRPDRAAVNYEPDALIATMDKLARATILLSNFVSEDAGELAMESFQEALSNAVYGSIGGMLASIANYRGGAMPPQGLPLGNGEEALSVYYRSIIDAFAGYNVHYTIANEAMRINNSMQQFMQKLHKLDDMARALEALSDIHGEIMRAAPQIIHTAVTTLLDTFYTQLGVLYRRVGELVTMAMTATRDRELQLIGDMELQLVYTAVMNELDYIDSYVDDLLADLEALAQEIPTDTDAANVAMLGVTGLLAKLGDVTSMIGVEWRKYTDNLQEIRMHSRAYNVEYCMVDNITGEKYCGGLQL